MSKDNHQDTQGEIITSDVYTEQELYHTTAPAQFSPAVDGIILPWDNTFDSSQMAGEGDGGESTVARATVSFPYRNKAERQLSAIKTKWGAGEAWYTHVCMCPAHTRPVVGQCKIL